MEETIKVGAVVGSAVIMAFIGYAIRGGFGAAMGFVLTLLVVWLFSVWKRSSS